MNFYFSENQLKATNYIKLLLSSFLLLFVTHTLKAQTMQIGSGTTNTNYLSTTIPLQSFSYGYSQQIVNAQEFSLAGGIAGNITKIRWMFPNPATVKTNYGDWDVWIGHTTKTEFASTTDWEPMANLTQVFSGNIHTLPLPPTADQWFEIEFSTPFAYNGTDNIVVAVHEKTPGWAATGLTIRTYVSTPNSGIVYRNNNTNPDPANPPTANTRVAILPQLQLEGVMASCVPPTDLTFTKTSLTSATLEWTSDGNLFDVEWGEEGFTLGNGTQINGITTNSASVTTIINTDHQFYVRRDCGNNDLSLWNGPFNFSTGYCIPTFSFDCSDFVGPKITTFEISEALVNLTNETGLICGGTNGFSDFTNMSATISEGLSPIFSVKIGGNSSARVKIWIDWDQNGEFEDDELLAEGTTAVSSGNSFDGAINIPQNTPAGDYRLRIRILGGASTNFGVCQATGRGETEDYTLKVVSQPSCLPPGLLTATPTSLSSVLLGWTSDGTLFDIEWGETGFTLGSGTQINGITTNSTTVTVVTDTPYQFYARQNCGNGNFSIWRGPFSFKTGYCTDLYSIGCMNNASKIVNFKIQYAITNLDNQTGITNCGAVGYNDFTDIFATVSEGFLPFFSVEVGTVLGGIKLWIDWNQNGEFEPNELIEQSTGNITPGNTFSGTFTVPSGTAPGDYRIRVRLVENSTNFTACSSHLRGETEDYTLKVVAPPSCLPPISLTATQTSLTTATLSWTSGGNLFDVEWGETGFALGNGTQINGITTNSVSVTTTIDIPYQFYARQDCGNGDSSSWQGPFSFKTGYCENLYANGCSNLSTKIKNFEINDVHITLANSTGTVNCGENGYSNYSYMYASASAEQTASFVVDIAVSSAGIKLWIDWNGNGIFEDDEMVAQTTTNIPLGSFTGSFTIPNGTPLGEYRLRVRAVRITTNFDACSLATLGGETEDYTFKVIESQTCLTPTSLTATQTSLGSATLGWTSAGTLFDVEWGEAGFELGTGTQINGIDTNSVSVNPTLDVDYHFYIRQNCGNGDVSLWQGPFNFKTGYCVPIYNGIGCTSFGAKITNFEINDAVVNLANNTGNDCGEDNYRNFAYMVAMTSASIVPSFSVTIGSTAAGVKLWIDWNQNGEFEANELIAESSTLISVGNSFTGIINVPQNTPLGDYRLRIRIGHQTTNFGVCSLIGAGETEDYTLRVVAEPTCMYVVVPKATNYSQTSVLLQWTSDGNLFDIEYGPQGFIPTGTPTNSQVGNPYILSGLTPGENYQYYVRQNCGSGDESVWRGPISFTPGNYTEKIPTLLSSDPQVTDVSCGGMFAIDVPAGKQIASLKVAYTMTSASPRWVSEQRSVLYSSTLNVGENAVISGDSSDEFPGVQDYSRFVDFANGATGTVEFELKAWRVAGNSGCTDNEIFVEAGTWILTSTFEDIPACPNPPTNLGYDIISESSVELFWTAGENGATHQLKWDVVGFNPDTNGTSEDNLTANSLILAGLDASIQYEFYVRRDCGSGDFSIWTGPFRFNSGYCLPYSNFVYYFTAFSTSNAIENITYNYTTPSTTGYMDNTTMIIEQEAGESFSFNSNYLGGASGLRIWIDWNNDLVFDDSEEVFYEGGANGNKSGTIAIPSDKLPGDYRLRVRSEQGASSIPPACGEIGFGETMDFTFRVACPTIAPPTGEASQTFNAGQTIADLVVNGTDLVWYSDVALTTNIPDTTALIDGTTYYVVSENGICKSSALAITFTDCVNVVSTPTGEASQTFIAGQTIADLVVNGTNLIWYSDTTYSNELNLNEELVNEATYYVVSKVGICQSDVLIITVILTVNVSSFDMYGFSYYPNPVNDVLHFSSNTTIENVVVSNMLGQKVNVALSSDNTILDLSDLPTGNYFVKVTIVGIAKMIKIIKN